MIPRNTKKQLHLNKQAFEAWLSTVGMTLESFAKNEIFYDLGNFSKMLRGEIPTPKHIIEKVLLVTKIDPKILIDFS